MNGKFVVAGSRNSDARVLRKLVIEGPRSYLMPLNPAYLPIETDDSIIIDGVAKRCEYDA